MRRTDFFGKKRVTENVEKTAEEKKKAKIRNALILAIGIVIALISILVIIFVWGGRVSFFDVFKSGK